MSQNGEIKNRGTPMQELIRYETARRALADAHAVDEVKDIRDKALALAAYARQAKNYEMEIMAAEIRVCAERRAGDLLEEMDKHPPGPKKQDPSSVARDPPKLSDLGIIPYTVRD
jgi:hypothetical protein